jgi:subtilisin family serine protease
MHIEREDFMRSVKLHLLVVVLACTTALTVPAFAERNKPLRGSRPDRLLALAAQKGTIRVIVGVAIDEPAPKAPRVRTESAEATAEPEELQRREIKEKKATLLGAHPRGVRRVADRDFQSIPYFVAEVDEEGLRELLADERVTSIEENVAGQVQLMESTQKVGSTTANASGYRGAGQYIVIIDTGVASDHPFLTGRIVGTDSACFSGGGYHTVCQNQQTVMYGANAGAPCPIDDEAETCDHGTHVAGIAAGRNNGNGFNGVAPDAWIIPIQVASWATYCISNGHAYPCGATVESSDVLAALDYVNTTLLARHPVAAVNISIRFSLHDSRASCDAANPAFASIISILKSKKVAVVAGTGNDREISGTGLIGMPACITGAIAVGASTDGDTTAFYSNTGFQDLMAPGGEPGLGIYSSIPGYAPNLYVEKSGTSMASPHVAGAFALLRSAKPTATVQKLLDDLKVTGTAIPDWGIGGWTFPRINIPAAIARP